MVSSISRESSIFPLAAMAACALLAGSTRIIKYFPESTKGGLGLAALCGSAGTIIYDKGLVGDRPTRQGRILAIFSGMTLAYVLAKGLKGRASLSFRSSMQLATLASACIALLSKPASFTINPSVDSTQDKYGCTALHVAVYNGHVEAVKALIEANVNLDTQAKDGCTALHVAVYKGHVEAVKMLIKAKANLDTQDENGLTALQIAQDKNYAEIAKLLEAAA